MRGSDLLASWRHKIFEDFGSCSCGSRWFTLTSALRYLQPTCLCLLQASHRKALPTCHLRSINPHVAATLDSQGIASVQIPRRAALFQFDEKAHHLHPDS